jgi:DNA gyrase/topoisomerase IV subunit B
MTMIDAFGLYIDTKTMKVTYDKDSLRYGKIIIESDADVDGEPSVSADERLCA